MTDESSIPPLPRLSLAKYAARKLSTLETLSSLVGHVLTEETRTGISERLALVLSVPSAAIWGSLLSLVGGRQISSRDIVELATRLVGNTARLKTGKAVFPWSSQAIQEWSACQFVDADDHITRSGKRGYLFRVFYLTGSPAGTSITRFLSSRYCHHAGTALGFSRRRPMDSPRQLVNYVAFALVDPELSAQREYPAFTQLSSSPAMRDHNTRLFDARDLEQRKDRPANCPNRFKFPCYRCPLGYEGDKACELATRQQTLQQGVCVECGVQTSVKVYSRIKGAECLRCRLRYLGAKTR